MIRFLRPLFPQSLRFPEVSEKRVGTDPPTRGVFSVGVDALGAGWEA